MAQVRGWLISFKKKVANISFCGNTFKFVPINPRYSISRHLSMLQTQPHSTSTSVMVYMFYININIKFFN